MRQCEINPDKMKSKRMEPRYLVQEGPEEWGLSRPPALTSPALCRRGEPLQGVGCCGTQGTGEQNELAIFSLLRNRKSKEEISVYRLRLQMAVPHSEAPGEQWKSGQVHIGGTDEGGSCSPTPNKAVFRHVKK